MAISSLLSSLSEVLLCSFILALFLCLGLLLTWKVVGKPSLLCCRAAYGWGASEGTMQLPCSFLAHFTMNSHVRLRVSPMEATAVVHSKLWVLVFPWVSPSCAASCLSAASPTPMAHRLTEVSLHPLPYQSGCSVWLFNSMVIGVPCSLISSTSGCLLILDWLVFSFWLCNNVKGFYLRLHLG